MKIHANDSPAYIVNGSGQHEMKPPQNGPTTEPDLITEVEEQIELLNKVNWSYYESIRGVVVPVPELLRRLVEEVKRDRDALKAMVELWDANHADDPCACTGADYSVGQHPVTCELCVARELMEGRNPNAE